MDQMAYDDGFDLIDFGTEHQGWNSIYYYFYKFYVGLNHSVEVFCD